MRKINILLTKYSDCISQIVYYIGGFGYTHASISLEEDENTYYSFNYKGFAVETIEKHRHRGVQRSIRYQLQISEEAYQSLREGILAFQRHRKEYRYTRLGLMCCVLKIPFSWKRHYFCSQFVAELLIHTKEIPLRKPSCLYLPNHFRSELERMPELVQISYNAV